MATQFMDYVVSSIDNMDSMVVYWYFNPLDGGASQGFSILMQWAILIGSWSPQQQKMLEALKI
jgi:hypothetical protein